MTDDKELEQHDLAETRRLLKLAYAACNAHAQLQAISQARIEQLEREKAEAVKIGAVMTYSSDGMSGVAGQMLGADGSGDFAVLFTGERADCEAAARLYYRRLEKAGHRLNAVSIVANDRGWKGDSVRIVSAPLKDQS